jgi:hypothetical protein
VIPFRKGRGFGKSNSKSLPLLPPAIFPPGYDSTDNVAVELPRTLISLLAQGISQWEHRRYWDSDSDYESGHQAALLLQERLLTPVETITLTEQPSTPATPAAGKAVLFLRDNGSGKSQLCIVYDDGSIGVIDTQP